MIKNSEAVRLADMLYKKYRTREPEIIAKNLGITIFDTDFKIQKGVYKYYERNAYIFIKSDLDPVMRSIVLAHEIGHHMLHRNEALKSGALGEFTIFDMSSNRMEYEANVFAAEIMLPDAEILEYISYGYDIEQIAKAMNSDINLVALKVAELNTRGFKLKAQESNISFLGKNKNGNAVQ